MEKLFTAVVSVGVGLALRWALNPLLGSNLPFVTLFPALIVAGALGGWLAGGTALVLAGLGAWLLYLPEASLFTRERVAEVISLTVFALSGGLAVSVAALLRTAADRLAEQEADARRAAERLRATQEAQALLMREVDHRSRNMLAVIQAVLRLTPRHDPETFVKALTGRIQALAHAHGLLADRRWVSVGLREIVCAELEPYAPPGAGRCRVDGPAVKLKPLHVQPLVLVFHELATNAAKYGALCGPVGTVAVTWERVANPARLVICWAERGGPAVSPPDRQGFGMKLITSSLTQHGGADLHLDWSGEGLTCTITLADEHLDLEGAAAGCATHPARSH